MTSDRSRSVVTAAEMARLKSVDPKVFRAALRRENLAWHSHNGSWTFIAGSPEHADLVRVLASISADRRTSTVPSPTLSQSSSRSASERHGSSICAMTCSGSEQFGSAVSHFCPAMPDRPGEGLLCQSTPGILNLGSSLNITSGSTPSEWPSSTSE